MSNPDQKPAASMIGPAGQKKKSAPAPSGPPKVMQWARVLEDRTVTVNRGGFNQAFTLKTGKEISNENFDFTMLKNRGVKLEILTQPPGWWLEAQRRGNDRHAELTAAGIELGDAPPLPAGA